ncbi:hypothetical protein [Streptomyces cavernae]|uniref:hypothetical protein n=1 Tax=Streptomyces cavernae TaxID=2259034 RepID=UPI000FEB73D7|nr:hypothetical protein [Streptomyces cavernae]
MNHAERRISGLLRQIATGDSAVLTDRGNSPARLAALVYIAEQYGFRYAQTRRVGQRLEVDVLRDRGAEAQRRAVATLADFPQAGTKNGPAPGMRRRSLKPLRHASEPVALLRARIEYDAQAGDLHWRPKAVFMSAVSLALTLLFLPVGWLTALAVGLPTFAIFMIGLWVEVLRKDRIARRLRAAGFDWD